MTLSAPPITEAMLQQLTRLSYAIGQLDEDTYASDPGTGLSGPMGTHVRHALGHVAALLDGLPGGIVDYDTRARGTVVERDPREAGVELRRLSLRLATLDEDALARPIRVNVMVDSRGTRAEVLSTIGRELLFVASHTTHHEAIMAMLMHGHAQPVPARFGVAPATPALTPCAP